MAQSPRLAFPYLQPNQAQKHVTLNEALRLLDIVTSAAIVSRSETTEPDSPSEGDIYILPTGASGDSWMLFAEDSLAAFQDGVWVEILPPNGLRAWIEDENALCVFADANWIEIAPARTARLGINADATSPNLLTVKSDAVLFSHDDVTPGSGDIRLAMNREAAGAVASVIFQTEFTGHAEVGLLGSGNLAFRTSSDGSTFNTGIELDQADGGVSFPSGFADAAGVLSALGFRRAIGTILNDATASVDFGHAVYGAAILAVPNATSSAPAAFFFIRAAPSPAMETLFSAGAPFTIGTETLTGTSGEDGKVNFSVSDSGVLTIENRRGYAIGYTIYAFER